MCLQHIFYAWTSFSVTENAWARGRGFILCALLALARGTSQEVPALKLLKNRRWTSANFDGKGYAVPA